MLQPQYLDLDKLLQRRLFEIPDYQRTYNWSRKQRSDLFDDIEKLDTKSNGLDKDNFHFMATVVCLNTKRRAMVDADQYETLYIVDGQQRLTTLIILFKEIALALDKKEPTQAKIRKDLESLLVKGDKRIILIQTNHDSSNVFRNYLRDNKLPDTDRITVQADMNLLDAIDECREFVKHRMKNKPSALIDLLTLLKYRLTFILHILEEERMVYTVFEVLNSRGLDVDWLDKCKSLLMGTAYESFDKAVAQKHIEELHDNWKKIYAAMGLKMVSGEEILRFGATLRHEVEPSKTLGAEEALAAVRKFSQKDPGQVIDFSHRLLQIAEELELLNSSKRREAVTKIAHARLLAIAILLLDDLTKEEKELLLSLWERVTFRIFGMCQRDARTKVGDYTRLAWRLANKKVSDLDQIRAEIKDLGKDYPIDFATQEFSKLTDCYEGWQDELRYFFWRYEEHLASKDGITVNEEVWDQIWSKSSSSTIEHIFPQEPGQNSPWIGKFGKGNGVLENNVNRLGNLLVLPPGINAQAGNKGFDKKKEIYKKIRLRLMDDILVLSDWNKKELNARQEKLIAWAKVEWRD